MKLSIKDCTHPPSVFMKSLTLAFCLFCLTTMAYAQRKQHQVRQADPRFTLRLESYFSKLVADEEFFYYVKNNTNQEYRIVVDVTANYACVGERTFKLGVNKVVYLPPNGEFTPKSDWVHSVLTSDLKGKAKECAMKFGDSYTYLKGISYRISNVQNLTEEKAAAEKKKADDLAAKQKKLAEDKAKAEKEKLAKETAAKEAAAKDKAAKEAAAKKATVAGGAVAAKTATSAKGTGTTGTGKTTAGNGTAKTNATASKKEEASSNVATENLAKQQQAAQLAAQQKAEEEARRVAEAAARAKKQEEYDKWKAQKDKEQSVQDAASLAASVGMMTLLGGWIYDNMGNFDPMFALSPEDENKRKFHMGLDFGYSLSTMPILYPSTKTTMVGGEEQVTKAVVPKQPFTFNIEAFWKVGMDHKNYGGYAYLNPKLGFSPIFDGFQFSPFNYGARVYGGAKWAKAYFGYGGGQRQFTHTSHDTEETGKGNSVANYSKFELGLLFTTSPDQNYRRSHISIGIINEKITPYDIGDFGLLDPDMGGVVFNMQRKNIQGFAFQWRKDHTFNWYINVYPEFVYTGEIKDAGGLSSDFSTKKTNTFFEMGFIRALDFY